MPEHVCVCEFCCYMPVNFVCECSLDMVPNFGPRHSSAQLCVACSFLRYISIHVGLLAGHGRICYLMPHVSLISTVSSCCLLGDIAG